MHARTVDHNAIKFTQVSLAVLGASAFILDIRWLVWLLAVLLLASVAWPQKGAFRLLYERIVLPRGWLRPNPLADDPAPHRFAQGVGGVCLGLSGWALSAGASGWGWALLWLVVALALVNAVFGFCAGCFIYYQLRRVGLIKVPQAD